MTETNETTFILPQDVPLPLHDAMETLHQVIGGASRIRRNTQKILHFISRCITIIEDLKDSINAHPSNHEEMMRVMESVGKLDILLPKFAYVVNKEAALLEPLTHETMSSWESNRNEIRELVNEAYDEEFKPSKNWQKDVEAVVRLDDYLWLNLIAQDLRGKGIDLDIVRKVDQIAVRILGEEDQATRDEDIKTAMGCWSPNTVDLSALTLSHDYISRGLSSYAPAHNPKEAHPSPQDEPSRDWVSSSSSPAGPRSRGIKYKLLKLVDSLKEHWLDSYAGIAVMSSILSAVECSFILLVIAPEPEDHVPYLLAKPAYRNALLWLGYFAVLLNIGCVLSSPKVTHALLRMASSNADQGIVLGPARTLSGEAGLTKPIDADGRTRLLKGLSFYCFYGGIVCFAVQLIILSWLSKTVATMVVTMTALIVYILL